MCLCIKIVDFIIFKLLLPDKNLEFSGHCAVSRRVPCAELRERERPLKKRQNDVSMARKFKSVILIISTAMYLKLR